MDSDYRSGVSSSAGREEVPRSSFFQQLTGVGPEQKILRTERFKLRKEHQREKSMFEKEQHKRDKEFVESLEDRRERFFRESGLPQFINRSPTKEERSDWRLARTVERYEKTERVMTKNFEESKRDMERQMKRGYEKRKKELPKQLRKQGPAAFMQSHGSRPVLYQIFGVNKRSSDPRAKNTLSA